MNTAVCRTICEVFSTCAQLPWWEPLCSGTDFFVQSWCSVQPLEQKARKGDWWWVTVTKLVVHTRSSTLHTQGTEISNTVEIGSYKHKEACTEFRSEVCIWSATTFGGKCGLFRQHISYLERRILFGCFFKVQSKIAALLSVPLILRAQYKEEEQILSPARKMALIVNFLQVCE